MELEYALTIRRPNGTEENFSQEMMQSYFQQQEGENFNLLFDSAEQAQNYIDTYKAAVTYDGSEVLSESITMAPQPQSSVVIMDQHTGYVKAIVGGRGRRPAVFP